ncbi:hypothetical protein [Streptomyces sp. B21-083]|uniref:hypothetical protein n=1 Tax=Streptomyces sp. B21-083 TaxID=3039410 RepID=UPI002FF045E7
MNTTSAAVAGPAVFVWLGMVLAISFLEAPLKFRAPGVTIPIGLGIGRLVFQALNLAEAALAGVVILAVVVGSAPAVVTVLTVMVAVLLVGQLAVIRPRLNRRSDRILAGEELPRSRGHLQYVTAEIAKVVVLIALGISVLAK